MPEPPIGARLRIALEDKGWSYTRLIAEMRRVAARERVMLPTTQSLVVMLSRWCNDHERPSEFYRSILSKALGRPPGWLGLVDPPKPAGLSTPPSGFVEEASLLGASSLVSPVRTAPRSPLRSCCRARPGGAHIGSRGPSPR